MSRECESCGKKTVAGRNLPRKGLPRKKGGAGQHIGVKSKRVFKPNLVTVRRGNMRGAASIRICARCLRSGRASIY